VDVFVCAMYTSGMDDRTLIGPIGQLVVPGETGLTVWEPGGLLFEGTHVVWSGHWRDRPPGMSPARAYPDRCILPGFVDPHTHVVFGGDRFQEFQMRQAGKSYAEILEAGGGIHWTVQHTREATEETLYHAARARLREMLAQGTTTVEIKTGYGLSPEEEAKLLRVIQRLREEGPQHVVPTFLGAHVVPGDMPRTAYLEQLKEMMVHIQGQARFVDVFVDRGAFTVEEAELLLSTARTLGFRLKVHMDELSHTGMAPVAARLQVVSADHLDHTPPEDLTHLARAGITAVLLPTVTLFLKGDRWPDVATMRRLGLRRALATDMNPGSSPYYSQQTVMREAVRLLGFTPEEALLGITYHAAHALDLHHHVGTLRPGFSADFLVLDRPHWGYLFYEPDRNPVQEVWIRGTLQWERRA